MRGQRAVLSHGCWLYSHFCVWCGFPMFCILACSISLTALTTLELCFSEWIRHSVL